MNKYIILVALKEKLLNLKRKRDKTISEIDNNPHVRFIAAHRCFSEFTKKFTGKERISKNAIEIFNKIYEKYEKAKIDMLHYDSNELHNNLADVSEDCESLEVEIAGIEYRNKQS